MQQGYRSLRECVFHSPLGLSCLPSKTRQLASYYLPAETGIEIEVRESASYEARPAIRQLHLVDSSSDSGEQRFCIRGGEEGMIELYKVCQILKKYYKLNKESGIHYHTSAPWVSRHVGVYIEDRPNEFGWVLDELSKWGYTGEYNKRNITCDTKGNWVNMRPTLETVEYRIGEMSFDYDILIKRIIHCHSITKRIRQQLKNKGISLADDHLVADKRTLNRRSAVMTVDPFDY